MERVRSFDDIPLLFVSEGEEEMGATRKKTPERLDKIIQLIWDYQDKHNGETPTMTFIGNHIGVQATGVGYWINLLVDDGRLDRISSRPFRTTITEHPKNKSAIDRWKRLRAIKERDEEAERDRIREEQARTAQTEQRERDRATVLEAAVDQVAAPSQRPPSEMEIWERQTGRTPTKPDPLIGAIDSYATKRSDYYAAQRAVKAEMPKLLKIADERDLVLELVNRGYTVAKNR
jgi:hypothetical protein